MSIEALKWALDIGEELGLEPPRRLVLIMLGNSADPAGGNLFPSHAYISRRTGLATSTVRAHLAALQKIGLLIREPRHREDRGQTSNNYRLAMRQPGLGLDDTPLPESSRGGHVAGTPPASREAPPPPHSMVLKQEVGGDAGQGKPSPVAACFEAYRHGIKTVHGAEYPPSASANGMLAQLVKKLGAEPALQVVRAYVASTKPFYLQRKHALEILAKDGPTIWIELQQRSGARREAPVTAAKVEILNEAGEPGRRLQDYPPGDAQQIAKQAFADYRNMIAKLQSARYINVRQGAQAARFSIEELRA